MPLGRKPLFSSALRDRGLPPPRWRDLGRTRASTRTKACCNSAALWQTPPEQKLLQLTHRISHVARITFPPHPLPPHIQAGRARLALERKLP